MKQCRYGLSVAVVLSGGLLSAVPLEVPVGGTTISSSATYDSLVAHGNVDIAPSAKLTINGPAQLAQQAGEVATVTVGNKGQFTANASSTGYVKIDANGGRAKFEVSAGTGQGTGQIGMILSGIEIAEDAATEPGTVLDILQMNAGSYAATGDIVNKCPNADVRFLFNGGRYVLTCDTKKGQGNPAVIPDGRRWIWESVNGNPIHIQQNYVAAGTFMGSRTDWSGGGYIETVGSGDLIFNTLQDGDTGVFKINRTHKSSGITFHHTGDLVLTNQVRLLLGEQGGHAQNLKLPSGEGRGIVRLYVNSKLDLGGANTAVNGLVATGTSCVTNSRNVTTYPSSLSFGTWNEDSTLQARITRQVKCIKQGSGTLTVQKTDSDGILDIQSGTVDFSDSFFSSVSVSADTLLRLGRNLGQFDVTTRMATMPIAGDGTMAKTGVSAVQLGTTAGSPKNLSVEGGTLAYVGLPLANDWYRFTFKKTRRSDGATKLRLFTMAFIDEKGTDLTTRKGYTFAQGVAPTEMAPGSYTVRADARLAEGVDPSNNAIHFAADKLMAEDYSNWSVMQFEDIIDPDDPATWQTVTFRLAAGAKKIAGYAFCSDWYNNNMPSDWTVETSPDGVSWEVVDERKNYRPYCYSTRRDGESSDYKWWNCKSPIGWTKGSPVAGSSFTGTAVSISGAATLGLAAFETVSLASLEVDCATGGTLDRFVPAANGALYLTNVPADVQLRRYAVPLTIGAIESAANLASWKVYVNGNLDEDAKLIVNDDGTGLTVRKLYGLMLILK